MLDTVWNPFYFAVSPVNRFWSGEHRDLLCLAWAGQSLVGK